MSRLHLLLAKLENGDRVKYDGLRLPPKSMRFCTAQWKDDAYYVESAVAEVERLVRLCNLDSGSALLDIGSGQGRLANGLIKYFSGEFRDYLGLDVHAPSVDWCKSWITRYHPSFIFERIDVANERYNADGKMSTHDLKLPCQSDRFDVVFLYSVFTHMRSADIDAYLGEIRRVLRPTGRAFLTAYVEKDVPDEESNPADYLLEFGEYTGPLHRVRFNEEFFATMIRRNGLQIERLMHASEEQTGQSSLVVRRADGQTAPS